MSVDYGPLSKKLSLLSRPRLKVEASEEGVQVQLLPKQDRQGTPLVAYRFSLKEEATPLQAEVILAMSEFLETAAMMLERRSKGKNPTAFAQDLYNHGFWANPAGGSDVLRCEILSIDYKSAHWDE